MPSATRRTTDGGGGGGRDPVASATVATAAIIAARRCRRRRRLLQRLPDATGSNYTSTFRSPVPRMVIEPISPLTPSTSHSGETVQAERSSSATDAAAGRTSGSGAGGGDRGGAGAVRRPSADESEGTLVVPSQRRAAYCCGGWCCCRCQRLTKNSKSLITNAVLFFTITGVQYVAALPMFANSLALKADCLSMFVDGLSYLGNLAAECNPDSENKRAFELAAAGISLSVLLGFTIFFLFEAIDNTLGKVHEDDHVDPYLGKRGGGDVLNSM